MAFVYCTVYLSYMLADIGCHLCSSGGLGKIYLARREYLQKATFETRPPMLWQPPELDILDDHMDFVTKWYEFLKKKKTGPWHSQRLHSHNIPWAFETNKRWP